jgi:hypothetical protein
MTELGAGGGHGFHLLAGLGDAGGQQSRFHF